jgi:hypothetical protein
MIWEAEKYIYVTGGEVRKEETTIKAKKQIFLLKSCETQNFITIKTSWNTND